MEEEYVKINKSFLINQWQKLNNRIREIEELRRDENFPTEELRLLRNSFQDISFIISKTKPLNETT